MSRHLRWDRGRCHGRLRRAIITTVLTLTLAFAMVAAGDPSIWSKADTVEAFALIATPRTDAMHEEFQEEEYVRAPAVPEIAQSVSQRLDEGSLPSSAGRTENVHAGRFLEVKARVYGPTGLPLPGSTVVFVWRANGTSTYETALSDASGVATVRKWIEYRQRGQRTVLVVSANKGLSAATAYTWFVPE